MNFYDNFEYKYFAGEYLVTPDATSNRKLIDHNNIRMIGDNVTKLVFRSSSEHDEYTHKIPLTINNMSVLPDSVRYLTIIPKFGPLYKLPKDIKKVYFHDYDSVIDNIPNMILWPDVCYMIYHRKAYKDISNPIGTIKYVCDRLPQPIYEEIIQHLPIWYYE